MVFFADRRNSSRQLVANHVCGSRVFSQVLNASTCSPAHRRDRRQSFAAGLVGAAILTLVPNARFFVPGLLTSLGHCVWE